MLSSQLPAIVQEFRAHANNATDASLAYIIFFVCGIGAHFVTVTLDCGQVLSCIHHIPPSSSALCPFSAWFIAQYTPLTDAVGLTWCRSPFPYTSPYAAITGFLWAMRPTRTLWAEHASASRPSPYRIWGVQCFPWWNENRRENRGYCKGREISIHERSDRGKRWRTLR